MKKLLNTLYVTTQDTYLRKEGETVVVGKEEQVLLRLPIHTLQGIVTFGNVMTSPFLLNLCAERGVCVSFMSESGKFLARVTGPVSGNVLLRLAQMRAYEDKPKKGEIARSFVIGKLLNARNAILRRIRDHGESDALRGAAEKHADVIRRVRDSPPDAERMRGLEGEAAAAYFGCFNELLVAQKEKQDAELAPLDFSKKSPLKKWLLPFFLNAPTYRTTFNRSGRASLRSRRLLSSPELIDLI